MIPKQAESRSWSFGIAVFVSCAQLHHGSRIHRYYSRHNSRHKRRALELSYRPLLLEDTLGEEPPAAADYLVRFQPKVHTGIATLKGSVRKPADKDWAGGRAGPFVRERTGHRAKRRPWGTP